MTCDETRDTLSAYLDEALAPDERRVVDAHLEGCAECRRELEALRGTVALLQRVEPARAPVGFVDRVVAAARPRPWYRRVADAVLLPLSVKLPLEAAAVVMVGLLAVYFFERSPELQRAAREVAPSQEAAAPAKEKPEEMLADKARPAPAPSSPIPSEAASRAATEHDRADARRSQEVPTGPAAPAGPRRPLRRRPLRRRRPRPLRPSADGPAPAGGQGARRRRRPRRARTWPAPSAPRLESRQRVLSPSASGDSARPAPSSSRLAAKRMLPRRTSWLAWPSRTATRRSASSTALVARLGGSVTQRRREDEATVVEAVIPKPRYAELSDGVARIGAWQLEAQRQDLPAQIHVIFRLQ